MSGSDAKVPETRRTSFQSHSFSYSLKCRKTFCVGWTVTPIYVPKQDSIDQNAMQLMIHVARGHGNNDTESCLYCNEGPVSVMER